MTFTQLRAFATVARVGSVTAAAELLGVTEPAVSSAIASLRRDVGDPLILRAPGGVRLTPGGERLAAAAVEILGVEDRMRREIGESHGTHRLLRLAVSEPVAEYVSAPLLDAYTRRRPYLEVAQEVAAPEDFGALLGDHRADVVLGPAPARAGAAADIDAVPFLRYKLVVVASPGHRLAGARDVRLDELRHDHWLVGPATADLERLFRTRGLPAPEQGAFVSEAAAQAAVATGDGVMLAIAHTVIEPVRRGSLARLDVRGMPMDAMWYAATLAEERCSSEATALRRFVTTSEATHAIVARPGGVPAGRFRPPVYVTIWSAVETA